MKDLERTLDKYAKEDKQQIDYSGVIIMLGLMCFTAYVLTMSLGAQ